jgi:hypothetical protein
MQPVAIQPAVCTILHLADAIPILTGADCMTGIRERTDASALPAVIIVGVEINLAPVFCYAVAVSPADNAGFDVTFSIPTAVLRVRQGAMPPAGSAMTDIGHQVHAVVG